MGEEGGPGADQGGDGEYRVSDESAHSPKRVRRIPAETLGSLLGTLLQ